MHNANNFCCKCHQQKVILLCQSHSPVQAFCNNANFLKMRHKRTMLRTTKDNQEVVGMVRRKNLSYANTNIRLKNVQLCKRVKLMVRNSKALKSNLQSRGYVVNNKPPMRGQERPNRSLSERGHIPLRQDSKYSTLCVLLHCTS